MEERTRVIYKRRSGAVPPEPMFRNTITKRCENGDISCFALAIHSGHRCDMESPCVVEDHGALLRKMDGLEENGKCGSIMWASTRTLSEQKLPGKPFEPRTPWVDWDDHSGFGHKVEGAVQRWMAHGKPPEKVAVNMEEPVVRMHIPYPSCAMCHLWYANDYGPRVESQKDHSGETARPMTEDQKEAYIGDYGPRINTNRAGFYLVPCVVRHKRETPRVIGLHAIPLGMAKHWKNPRNKYFTDETWPYDPQYKMWESAPHPLFENPWHGHVPYPGSIWHYGEYVERFDLDKDDRAWRKRHEGESDVQGAPLRAKSRGRFLKPLQPHGEYAQEVALVRLAQKQHQPLPADLWEGTRWTWRKYYGFECGGEYTVLRFGKYGNVYERKRHQFTKRAESGAELQMLILEYKQMQNHRIKSVNERDLRVTVIYSESIFERAYDYQAVERAIEKKARGNVGKRIKPKLDSDDILDNGREITVVVRGGGKIVQAVCALSTDKLERDAVFGWLFSNRPKRPTKELLASLKDHPLIDDLRIIFKAMERRGDYAEEFARLFEAVQQGCPKYLLGVERLTKKYLSKKSSSGGE